MTHNILILKYYFFVVIIYILNFKLFLKIIKFINKFKENSHLI